MARKSRKETAAVAVQKADAACRAAIYVRLSVEDTHTHSVSIETQQMIIARYLEQYPEISVYDTYIDNGATGTNFHRPGFQQMLSDIEAGHVNCVIVKDLSRLGRNTIDTGYYIEQYFRIRNIRFIAVNENFDTVAPEDAHSGIIIPLRNMINEAYALDIGRKIRAQQRQAMKDGKFIGARTPYGYLKAEDDCHQLIIDPVAAVVVQRIEHFYDFEQLPPVGGGVHGNKYVGQAVYGFHVAACRYPYHFCEWLRDCSGYKVYLILADFAGREYNTLV